MNEKDREKWEPYLEQAQGDPVREEEIVADMNRIEAAVNTLKPYFDTIQILTTKHFPTTDVTQSATWGFGNVYARKAHALEWGDKQ